MPETPHPVPEPDRLDAAPARSWRRSLAPGLAVAAVLAVALGTVAVVRHGDSPAPAGNPPVIRLANDGAVARAVDSELGASGPVKVVGTLPTAPTSAAARTLPAGAAPADVVAALAKALGLPGTPAHGAQGWRLSEGKLTLLVADTAGMPWSLLSADGAAGCAVTPKVVPPDCPVARPPGAAGCAVTPKVVPPDCPLARPPGAADDPIIVAPGRAPAPGGSKHPGGVVVAPSAGSYPGAPGRPAEPTGVPAPGKPADDAPPAGGNSAGGNSAGTGAPGRLPPDAPTQNGAAPVLGKTLPVPAKPTDDQALAAARPVLAALGIADARTRVDRLPGSVSVVADPVLDGLVTWGYASTVVVGADGKVTGGAGWLGRPAMGPTYPLVGAAELLKSLVFPAIARMCGAKVCPEQALEVSGAELGLSLGFQTSGTPMLLPAWRYTLRGRTVPLVLIAVQPTYLGRGDRPNVPGGAPPVPADPNGAANNGTANNGTDVGGGSGPGTGSAGQPGGQPGQSGATEPASPPPTR